MISQLPAIVKSFRALGVRSEVCHLAFEPSILDALPATTAPDIDVSFVGTVSADHQQRIALLEAVAERYDLKLWGNIPQALPASSPLHRCFQGEVWGAEMYQVLRRSRITLNSHIDMAGQEAGNMRLFEATGAGAFLLTDFKDNLHTAVRTRTAKSRCGVRSTTASPVIDRYLGDDDARAAIARAGQARTMAQHTYRQPRQRNPQLRRKNCERDDETSSPRQADRQTHRQGDADPAAPLPVSRPTIACSAGPRRRGASRLPPADGLPRAR